MGREIGTLWSCGGGGGGWYSDFASALASAFVRLPLDEPTHLTNSGFYVKPNLGSRLT